MGWTAPTIPDDTGQPPTQQHTPDSSQPSFQKIAERVILLSCFDGIGSSALALAELVDGIDLHLSWEVDPDCLAILHKHHPEAQARGNFLEDDPQAVADAIIQHDPTGKQIVLFLAAPPCPDFSRIRDDAPGSAGAEGQKFTAYCDFVADIESRIPHRRVGHLTENVVMEKGEADFFAKKLKGNTVMADAQDFGLISRPRLWWTRVDWSHIKASPVTGQRLQWGKSHKFYKLQQDVKHQEEQDLDMDGMSLHPDVASHKTRIPCLTTPAPCEGGRPPPKRMRGTIPPDQKMRWLNDNRTYAPWQYSEEAMVLSTKGELHVPSAKLKEQLHQLPPNYTEADGVAERSRHRLLGNGWHIGTARFMLMLVLQMILTISAEDIPTSPRRSALQMMLEVVERFPPAVGPGHWNCEPVCVPQAGSMWEHWEMACGAIHPLAHRPQIEPGWSQCLEVQQLIGGSLNKLRHEIVNEIQELADERSEATRAWWQQLPAHIANVYYSQEHDQISQIPLLIDLLHQTGMPQLPALAHDLQHGFAVTGTLNPGAGWLPRADQRYEFPVKEQAFQVHNRHYTMAKLQGRRVDPEWETMLQELQEEVRKGRMSGPYTSPSWWPMSSIGMDDRQMLQLPNEEVAFSFCFSVRQTDKVRRCEDFRRSGHNSTIVAYDVPHHHDIRAFTALALCQEQTDVPPKIWAQDLNGAYRQFPVQNPDDCFCVLMTPRGPLVLRHHALMFGATSSVWNFNRAADSLVFLSRRLLACTVGHYVDDFIGIEASSLVVSGYDQFTRLMRVLGFRMKEAKALPPATTQKVLGVNMTLTEDEVILAPHPTRCDKMIKIIQEAIQSNALSPDNAHRMAGKLTFLTSTLFGQLGRAALQPIYARAHGASRANHSDALNGPLAASLRTLATLLTEISPRTIPRTCQQPAIVIYTDAYFVLNDKQYSLSDADSVTTWNKKACPYMENGWGYVIHHQGQTRFGAGRVPPWLIQKFCTRKAYIYFLEVLAQLIAFLACRDIESNLVISFIDNSSGFFALKKGYCKDEAICNLIAITWRLIAMKGWNLHLEWVASQLNISDKVSRQTFEEMYQIGAKQDSVYTEALFTCLKHAAADHNYTYGPALQDIMAISVLHTQHGHTGKAGDLAPVWHNGNARCRGLQTAETGSTAKPGQKGVSAVHPF